MGETPIIELKNIAVSFDGEAVLKDFNLRIRGGEFVTLLGPSGCGKTTTLRIVGGFVHPDQGDVFFNGQKINDVPPHKREVNTIFQKYALFPHLNVYDNVAFGMRVHGKSEKEIKSTVKNMLKMALRTAMSIACPVANSSASPLPARWRTIQRFFFWTNRWARLTSSCARICRPSSKRFSSRRASPSFLSHTIRKRPFRCPILSW